MDWTTEQATTAAVHCNHSFVFSVSPFFFPPLMKSQPSGSSGAGAGTSLDENVTGAPAGKGDNRQTEQSFIGESLVGRFPFSLSMPGWPIRTSPIPDSSIHKEDENCTVSPTI